MAYHAVHGHDEATYGTPLTHRVLTVSAADVEAALSPASAASEGSDAARPAAQTRFVPTGIATLDAILAGARRPPSAGEDDGGGDDHDGDAVGGAEASQRGPPRPVKAAAAGPRRAGGVRRGQLTEIWGPPGAGKTAFGMQLVANALGSGHHAVWIDCFHPLCEERLARVVDAQARAADRQDIGDDADDADDADDGSGFVHYVCPSLPHFLALLCPPAPALPPCIPPGTALLVVDALSALVNAALPRTAGSAKGAPLMANGKRGPAPHEKRAQVLQYITAALERLAETRHLAVVVLTQCASRVQGGRGAALTPALYGQVWDRGIATRLVLFRDWAWTDRRRPVGGRFAGVQKLDGRASDTGIDDIVAFDITETGLVEEHYTPIPPRGSVAYKRKLGDTDLGRRGGDGDGGGNGGDDDYGWDDDDDSMMPNMPPQWQGSEDLLLGHRYDDEEEDEEDEGEEGGREEKEAAGEKGAHGGEGQSEPAPAGQRRARRSSQSVADSEDDSDV